MKLLGVGAGRRAARRPRSPVVAAPLALFGFARRPLGERAAFAGGARARGVARVRARSRGSRYTDMLLLLWFTRLRRRAAPRVRGCASAGSAGSRSRRVAAALAVLTKGAIGLLLPGAAGLVELALRGAAARRAAPELARARARARRRGSASPGISRSDSPSPAASRSCATCSSSTTWAASASPCRATAGASLYYVPVLLVGLFPWSPFAAARVRARGASARATSARASCACSRCSRRSPFVFFSIAATKLANYVAPALPGLALPIGALLAAGRAAGATAPFASSFGASARGFVGVVRARVVALPVRAARLPAAARSARGAAARRSPAALELGRRRRGRRGRARRRRALRRARLARGTRPSARSPRSRAASSAATRSSFQGVAARVDAQLAAPLRRLAVAGGGAGRRPTSRSLMLGLRHRSSVCFYGRARDRLRERRGPRRPHRRAVLRPRTRRRSASPASRSSRAFPARDRLELLERDGGYVLFRARGRSSEP